MSIIRSTTGSQDTSAEHMLKKNVEFRVDSYNLVAWVQENFSPEDVFPEDELETWAKGKGWVKEE